MASKYASLKTKLPAFTEESEYQQKVDNCKNIILDGAANAEDANAAALAARYERVKGEKDGIESALYETNIELEALSQLLVAAMEADGVEKFTLSSGATVYQNYAPYPVVEDREKLFAWIKAQRMQKLLSVQYQTLRGIVNEMLAAGKPLMPGVSCYLKTSARLLRSRNGSEE